MSFIKNLQETYNIIIWWDGTMLHAINKYYKNWNKFIWINFWNKWCLLQDKNIIHAPTDFISKEFNLYDISINGEYHSTLINEISISATWWKMWEFDIDLWKNKSFILKSDGIVIATPLWSSAYNSSLWGPLLDHNSQSIVFTPKAAWIPKNLSSIVLSNSQEINIKNIWRFHWLEIYTDGQWWKIENKNTSIRINKSKYTFDLAINKSILDQWESKFYNY
jgi:NAD kinase